MKIYPTHDEQMKAFNLERCTCGATREQHEPDGEYDGVQMVTTWGFCELTGCSRFERMEDQ